MNSFISAFMSSIVAPPDFSMAAWMFALNT